MAGGMIRDEVLEMSRELLARHGRILGPIRLSEAKQVRFARASTLQIFEPMFVAGIGPLDTI